MTSVISIKAISHDGTHLFYTAYVYGFIATDKSFRFRDGKCIVITCRGKIHCVGQQNKATHKSDDKIDRREFSKRNLHVICTGCLTTTTQYCDFTQRDAHLEICHASIIICKTRVEIISYSEITPETRAAFALRVFAQKYLVCPNFDNSRMRTKN